MKEARIECTCAQIQLPDLNLSLQRGQVVTLPEERAKASQNLRHAKKIGAVEVQYVERCKVTKRPVPPWLNPKTRRNSHAPSQVTRKPVPEMSTDTADMEAVASRAARLATAEMQAEVVALRQELSTLRAALEKRQSQKVAVDSGEIKDAVTNAIKDAIGSLPRVAPAEAPVAPTVPTSDPDPMDDWDDVEDEPLFIPTGIVSDEANAAINVESESSDSDVGAAVKALRGRKAPRKRKPRSKKTAKNSEE